MAVSTQIPRKVSTAAAGATIFPYDFKIIVAGDLLVEVDGVAKVLNVDYTVDGIGMDGGGDVTFLSPMAGGETVLRKRNMAYARDTDYQNLGDLHSATLNNDQDAPVLMIQQLADGLSRALRLPDDSVVDPTLPTPIPNYVFGWASNGMSVVNIDLSGVADLGLRPDLGIGDAAHGSFLLKHLSFGTGVVPRTVRNKLNDIVSVKDYGAIGDGVVDNTIAINSAIADAITFGRQIFWPSGTYNVSTGIANLHTVRHVGPGVLKRGASLFTMQLLEDTTNTIYVDPASSGIVKDGLTTFYAFTTLQDAFDALTNYGPALEGTWVISLAAGTYTEGALFPTGLRARKELTVQGPDVGGSPNVPTAIIDGTSSVYRRGIAGTHHLRMQLKDIKVQNFDGADEAGIEFSQWCRVRLNNVHSDNCYYGWHFLDWTYYDAIGGIIDGCDTGVQELFGVVRNYKAAASDALRTTIQNCTSYGLKAKELCTGHLDYAKIDNCNNGVFLSRCSTANLGDCDIYNNTIGAVCTSGSAIVDTLDVDWGAGTANANTIKFLLRGGSSEVVRSGGENVPAAPYVGLTEQKQGFDYDVVAHTGTAIRTTIYAAIHATRAGDLQAMGSHLRVRIYGSATSLAGTCQVELRTAAAGLCTVTLPASAGAFAIDMNLHVTANGDVQLQQSEARINGSVPVVATGTRAVAFSSADQTLDITATLSSASDTVTFRGAEVYATD